MPAWPTCPDCFSEETAVLHEGSPGASKTHATLRCGDCGRTFKALLEAPKQRQVSAVISEGATSRHVQLELPGDARVRLEDEVFGEDHRLLVTAIEHEDGRRVKTAPVESIKTLWCKVFDTVTIPVSVNKGHITHSDEMEVVPEEEFYVGDEITLHGQQVTIHAIKTERGIRHRGKAEAKEIVRMFAERTEFREARRKGQLEAKLEAERRERRRRGARRARRDADEEARR